MAEICSRVADAISFDACLQSHSLDLSGKTVTPNQSISHSASFPRTLLPSQFLRCTLLPRSSKTLERIVAAPVDFPYLLLELVQ